MYVPLRIFDVNVDYKITCIPRCRLRVGYGGTGAAAGRRRADCSIFRSRPAKGAAAEWLRGDSAGMSRLYLRYHNVVLMTQIFLRNIYVATT